MSAPIAKENSAKNFLSVLHNGSVFLKENKTLVAQEEENCEKLFDIVRHENQFIVNFLETANNWFYIKDTYSATQAV